MDFITHLRIGSRLYDWISATYAVKLDRRSFLIGCIKPDFQHLLTALKAPQKRHRFSECFPQISAKITEIARQQYPVHKTEVEQLSSELGEIMHYIMDFFCCPHNEDFGKTLVYHALYEKYLSLTSIFHSRVISENAMMHPQYSMLGLSNYLHTLHDQYLLKIEDSMSEQAAQDIQYATQACSAICETIFAKEIMAINWPVWEKNPFPVAFSCQKI